MRSMIFRDQTFKDPEKEALLFITKNAIKAGDQLDARVPMAQLWIHEWGHLVNKCRWICAARSETSLLRYIVYDMNAGEGLWNTNKVTHPTTGAIVSQRIYGRTDCFHLTHWRPADALATADTYAVFAMGTYLDNWGWAAGATTK